MGHSTKDTHSLQGGNFCRSGGGELLKNLFLIIVSVFIIEHPKGREVWIFSGMTLWVRHNWQQPDDVIETLPSIPN
jgi:hypothetical protein